MTKRTRDKRDKPGLDAPDAASNTKEPATPVQRAALNTTTATVPREVFTPGGVKPAKCRALCAQAVREEVSSVKVRVDDVWLSGPVLAVGSGSNPLISVWIDDGDDTTVHQVVRPPSR